MQFCSVTFVLAEAIFGKARAEVPHNRVPCDFRNDTRRRNAQAEAIAIDDRRLRKRKGENGETVDQHVVGPQG